MVASTGAFTDAHQDSNGLGTILNCVSGHKAFLVPIDPPENIIVEFGDIDGDQPIGFEYLYSPPGKFGCFVLAPNQTL